MSYIEHIYTKKEIRDFLQCKKTYNGTFIDFNKDIKKKLKPKRDNDTYFFVPIDLDNDFQLKLQSKDDEDEFGEYSAIMLYQNQIICRLDYHDGHRRNCKKDKFENLFYNDLHFHIYCEDCIKEGFKPDQFVLDINEEKIISLKFECFIELFCKIINLETSNFNCRFFQPILEFEND